MAYEKQDWGPSPDGTPKYINPTRMNHIEEGINVISAEQEQQRKELTDKINQQDIINNLETIDVHKPLSANMGKSINDMLNVLKNGKANTLSGEYYVNKMQPVSKTKTTFEQICEIYGVTGSVSDKFGIITFMTADSVPLDFPNGCARYGGGFIQTGGYYINIVYEADDRYLYWGRMRHDGAYLKWHKSPQLSNVDIAWIEYKLGYTYSTTEISDPATPDGRAVTGIRFEFEDVTITMDKTSNTATGTSNKAGTVTITLTPDRKTYKIKVGHDSLVLNKIKYQVS